MILKNYFQFFLKVVRLTTADHWEIAGQWNTEDKTKCIVTVQCVAKGVGKAKTQVECDQVPA